VRTVYGKKLTYSNILIKMKYDKRLLEKLTGSQLVKKLPAFFEPESSLAPLHVPATCPYSEADQSSPCLPHPTS
jgi:hypothetical protein